MVSATAVTVRESATTRVGASVWWVAFDDLLPGSALRTPTLRHDLDELLPIETTLVER
jgi:hypothetical protein